MQYSIAFQKTFENMFIHGPLWICIWYIFIRSATGTVRQNEISIGHRLWLASDAIIPFVVGRGTHNSSSLYLTFKSRKSCSSIYIYIYIYIYTYIYYILLYIINIFYIYIYILLYIIIIIYIYIYIYNLSWLEDLMLHYTIIADLR